MPRILIILLTVLIIAVVIGGGIYYFISSGYNINSFLKLAENSETLSTENQNQNQNNEKSAVVEKPNYLGDNNLEAVKQECKDALKGAIKFTSETITIKIDNQDRAVDKITITTDNAKVYALIGYDIIEYTNVGIKDGQTVEVYGNFDLKNKNNIWLCAVIPTK